MPLKNVNRWFVYADYPQEYRSSPGEVITPAAPPSEGVIPRIDVRGSISAYNHLWVYVKDGAGATVSIWVERGTEWYLFTTRAVTAVNECLMFEGLPAAKLAVTSNTACDLSISVTE